MDSKLFRLPTSPNFYAAIANANPFDPSEQQKRCQAPTPDSRFPGWAAPMADGRLVSDYQNHCSKNIPVGYQFATKEWMTNHATDIIRVGRERFSEKTGAIYGLDKTVVPPPAMIVACKTYDCERKMVEQPGGIGVERADSAAPQLFGTWESSSLGSPEKPRVAGTTVYEGGRNTPRGV